MCATLKGAAAICSPTIKFKTSCIRHQQQRVCCRDARSLKEAGYRHANAALHGWIGRPATGTTEERLREISKGHWIAGHDHKRSEDGHNDHRKNLINGGNEPRS